MIMMMMLYDNDDNKDGDNNKDGYEDESKI